MPSPARFTRLLVVSSLSLLSLLTGCGGGHGDGSGSPVSTGTPIVGVTVAVSSFAPTDATPGASVVITGTGLTGLTSVSFNGIASPSLTAASDTSVTAVVPAGASTGKITVVVGTTSASSVATFTADALVLTGYAACQAAAGSHKVTDFGSFTAGASDAQTRTTNTATLNAALDGVGKTASGGVVCLPPGSFYLTNRPGGTEAVVVTHDNTSLWGAGMDSTQGGTRLVTRSDWNLAGGQVFRGNGMRLAGTQDANAPLANITLRDFELDGGAGYTGSFNWPADPTTGDGWDITHKGIVVAGDACVDKVSLQRLWVHSFRGEVIYSGGHCLKTVTVDAIRAEDTNASTFNLTANFTVSHSTFGKSLMWMELGAGGPYDSSTWTDNTFHDAARFGIAIAQGDGRANTPHVFRNNSFLSCGNTAFYLGGGAGGPITISDNTFRNCSGLTTDLAANAASWAVGVNTLVTFENNTLTDVGTMAYLGASLTHSTLRNNTIVNTTGTVGATTATMLCGSNFADVVIENNTFIHGRTPEQSCPVTQGTRPLYRGNVYTSCESRDQQGTTHITATQSLIRPQFELAYVVTDTAGAVAQLATDLYADGQVVTISGASTANPLRFPAGQASYTVAKDRVLTGGTIQFTFSAAQKKWIDSTPG